MLSLQIWRRDGAGDLRQSRMWQPCALRGRVVPVVPVTLGRRATCQGAARGRSIDGRRDLTLLRNCHMRKMKTGGQLEAEPKIEFPPRRIPNQKPQIASTICCTFVPRCGFKYLIVDWMSL